MADQVITVQKLIDADKDATSLDTFINGTDSATVTTRKLRTYPSLAKAVKQVIETGGFEPFATETALLASVPTVTKKAAKALDTKKVWLWDGVQWNDTGLSELDIAQKEIDLAKKESAETFLKKFKRDIDGYFFALLDSENMFTDLTIDNSGQFAEFVIDRWRKRINDKNGMTFDSNAQYLFALLDKDNLMTDLAIRNDGQFAEFVVKRLAKRMIENNHLGDQYKSPHEFIFNNNKMQQAKPNMQKMVTWGSSSLSGLSKYLEGVATDFGVTDFYNGAKGGEMVEQILARMGAKPASITFTNPVTIGVNTVTSDLRQNRLMRPYTGKAGGYHGELSIDYNTLAYSFNCDSIDPNFVLDVDTAYEFIPDAVSYRDAICILNIGKNNFPSSLNNSAEYVAESTHVAVNFLKPFYKYVIVMGHFVNTGTSAETAQRIRDCNAMLKEAYGDLYYDLSAYVTSEQIWIDTGVTPNEEDLRLQSIGEKPNSLSADYQHLNSVANIAVTAQLKEKIKNLNWY